jgi:predicted nucleotidyltransferase
MDDTNGGVLQSANSYLEPLKDLFHVQMGRQTSGCLFGSGATGDWVEGRSDLDLMVLIPSREIEFFARQIEAWRARPSHPLLDGYVLFLSENTLLAKRFHNFDEPARLAAKSIPLIDIWNIKNLSTHLFGLD